MSSFYNESLECINRSDLLTLQFKRLKNTLNLAYDNVPFYRKKFKEINISPEDINSLDDLTKLSFTTKDDIREKYPFGLSSVNLKDLVVIHASSGTTGTPTISIYNDHDLDSWADMVARCLVMSGMVKEDIFQITPSFGMFTGGFGFFHGARKVGAAIIPHGAGFSKRQIQFMRDFGTTMICGIVSYPLRLAEVAFEMGIDPATDTKVRRGVLGSEIWSEEMRKKISKIWDMDTYDIYGSTELCGPGAGNDCYMHDGIHIWEDNFLIEVIDPDTGELLGPEEKGELVVTTLNKESLPLIRYRTRDLTYLYDAISCDCQRTHRRISRILGRVDDMVKVSGVNFWPSEVESHLLKYPEVGTEYQIIVKKVGTLDHMIITVESKGILSGDSKISLANKIKQELHEILLFKPDIQIVNPGTIPRAQGGTGKAIRLINDLQR